MPTIKPKGIDDQVIEDRPTPDDARTWPRTPGPGPGRPDLAPDDQARLPRRSDHAESVRELCLIGKGPSENQNQEPVGFALGAALCPGSGAAGGQRAVDCALQDACSSAYRPGTATSSACGPRCTTRPPSMTSTSSAASAVDSRWAMAIAVRPRVNPSSARCSRTSVAGSTAEVASSSTSRSGSAT